jgi:hypothetical protein
LVKHLALIATKKEKAAKKRLASEAKEKSVLAKKEEKRQAKLAAMSIEKRQAYLAKCEAKRAKDERKWAEESAYGAKQRAAMALRLQKEKTK